MTIKEKKKKRTMCEERNKEARSVASKTSDSNFPRSRKENSAVAHNRCLSLPPYTRPTQTHQLFAAARTRSTSFLNSAGGFVVITSAATLFKISYFLKSTKTDVTTFATKSGAGVVGFHSSFSSNASHTPPTSETIGLKIGVSTRTFGGLKGYSSGESVKRRA